MEVLRNRLSRYIGECWSKEVQEKYMCCFCRARRTESNQINQGYGKLNEGIGSRSTSMDQLDAGTKLKVKFRTGDIAFENLDKRIRKVDDDDDNFKCDCGSECEDRVHIVAECPLYNK
ncbi:unnamed protein product [Ectocarpus sp. 6 AP-2014]